MSNNELLTPAQAAQILQVTPATLAAWRREGAGPYVVELSERTFRYPREQLERWLLIRMIKSGLRDPREVWAEAAAQAGGGE